MGGTGCRRAAGPPIAGGERCFKAERRTNYVHAAAALNVRACVRTTGGCRQLCIRACQSCQLAPAWVARCRAGASRCSLHTVAGMGKRILLMLVCSMQDTAIWFSVVSSISLMEAWVKVRAAAAYHASSAAPSATSCSRPARPAAEQACGLWPTCPAQLTTLCQLPCRGPHAAVCLPHPQFRAPLLERHVGVDVGRRV